MSENNDISKKLDKLNELIERAIPPEPKPFDPKEAEAFLWCPEQKYLKPVREVQRVDIGLLHGIDQAKEILLENTRKFAEGYGANNALLWGTRGMGKSSLVKAVHSQVADKVKLVEIQREDIGTLIELCDRLVGLKNRFILFCDDLSFEQNDSGYKALKATLEGGIQGRAENCLFYATSNRRHLMPRDMIENEQATAINPNEATEEKVSLSDRFGLWIGFHKCSQDEYLNMVEAYFQYYKLGKADEMKEIRAQAIEWAATRGNRSGRIAFQFINDLAGKRNKKLVTN